MKNANPSTSVHDVVLLPCPFCGAEGTKIDDRGYCMTHSKKCCVSMMRSDSFMFITGDIEIDAWNTRVDYEDAESWRSMAKGFAAAHKASLGKDCGVWDSRNVGQ